MGSMQSMLQAISTRPPSCPAVQLPLPPPPCWHQQAVYAYDLCQCTGGRAGSQAIVGVAWRPVTFARAKNKQTNKQDESRKPFLASKLDESAGIYLLFDYKQR